MHLTIRNMPAPRTALLLFAIAIACNKPPDGERTSAASSATSASTAATTSTAASATPTAKASAAEAPMVTAGPVSPPPAGLAPHLKQLGPLDEKGKALWEIDAAGATFAIVDGKKLQIIAATSDLAPKLSCDELEPIPKKGGWVEIIVDGFPNERGSYKARVVSNRVDELGINHGSAANEAPTMTVQAIDAKTLTGFVTPEAPPPSATPEEVDEHRRGLHAGGFVRARMCQAK